MRGVASGGAKDRNQSIGNDAFAVYVPKYLDDAGNLCVNRGIKNTVTSADDRFVIIEGIPGKGNARSKVLLGSIQRTVLRIELVAQTVIHCEIRPELPSVLQIECGEGTRLHVFWIP